ncbi:MAG TPA: diguanylate cyclase [Ktedonobacteraceae bacterium]|nr:diguanylate cyclase [Ktedonobacteraceae bacterium]
MRHPFSTEQTLQSHQPCTCQPLRSFLSPGGYAVIQENFLPIASSLNRALRSTLAELFPRATPCSLLLLHIAQFEFISLSSTDAPIHKKLSYHAPISLQEQIVHIIQRTLRASDQVLTDEQGAGAAILFPQVDEEGIIRIVERVSRGIKLLQSETVVPPLQYETEITLGIASYPEPSSTLEEWLVRAGEIQEKITFRPVVAARTERPRTKPLRVSEASKNPRSKEARLQEARANGIPFMQIPSRLPTRLKQLIPYSLALKLRCAPVGRNHNQLTVAMANPLDDQAISCLHETTGMTIYPVSCEIAALETLLASGW